MAQLASSRRERFVDTEELSIVPLAQMRKDISDIYRVAINDYFVSNGKVQETLKAELAANSEYDQAWRAARKKYDCNSAKYSKQVPEECHLALICYTLEQPPLYKDFNRRCRNLTPATWEDFPYKSLWYLLTRALPKIAGQPKDPGRYYRGVGVHFSVDFSQFEKGNLIMFKSFTSTSVSKKVALDFIGETGGTLIEFQNKPLAGKGIKLHSAFSYEEEVLLWPWSSYQVVNLTREGGLQKLVLKSAGPLSAELPYSIS